MPVAVKLDDIVQALEMMMEEHGSFLDLETGEVVTVSDELSRKAEERQSDDEPPNLANWQKPEWQTAMLVNDHFRKRFKKLPTKFDVHEWAIMRQFAASVEAGPLRDELLRAIHGAGAFRHFKSILHRHGMQDDWRALRAEALRKIAIDFCEEIGVAWK